MEKCHSELNVTYIFPPSSLICTVTAASPIQTRAKIPEKTSGLCSPEARRESSKLRSRQKMSGPLKSRSAGFFYFFNGPLAINPNLVGLRSFRLVIRRLHPATFQRCLQGYCCLLLRAQRLQFLQLFEESLRAGTSAKVLGASSPILPAGLVITSPTQTHQSC